jgi:hypothetical protein
MENIFPMIDGGPSSPSTASFRTNDSSPKNTELFRLPSRGGFGVSTNRFDTNATFTPGVGSYNITPENKSSLLVDSPSLSRRGYRGSFGSKTPKFPPTLDSGVPGPNAYSIEATSMVSASQSRGSSPNRSAAFTPSGKGRIPFPDPQPTPGPNSYLPKDNPGVSPLLANKGSATFLSHSKRDSFIRISHTPSPAAYSPQLSPGKELPQGDIQWSKNPQGRFQDLGKDNKVPGPQRYFNPELDAKLYSPNSSLRTSGAYRGTYIGKQSEHGVVPPTFGTDSDRFKHSFCGRLDLIAEIPGPGAYHEDLSVFSTVKLKSHNIQFRTDEAASSLRANRPGTTASMIGSQRASSRSTSPAHTQQPLSPGRRPGTSQPHSPQSPFSANRNSQRHVNLDSPNSIHHASFSYSEVPYNRASPAQTNAHGFGHTNHVYSPPAKHAIRDLATGHGDFIQ